MDQERTTGENETDKASDTRDKLTEFLKTESPFVPNDISHEEFVAGIKSGAFKIIITDALGDADDLCTRKNKNALLIIKMICFLSPPLLIVAFSIVAHNWWFLFGIVVQYLTFGAIHYLGEKTVVYLLLVNIGYWFVQGFYFQDYFTFFSLTFIITAILWAIEKEYDIIFATRSIVNDPGLFRKALAQNKIIIERKTK